MSNQHQNYQPFDEDHFQKLWELADEEKIPADIVNTSWEKLAHRIKTKRVKTNSIRKFYKIAIVVTLAIFTSFIIHRSYTNTPQLLDNKNTGRLPKNILLPDGSRVTISPGSSLKYPQEFKGKYRLVHLKGKAFFEVEKNKQKPFIVKAGKTTTKVLGTSFNIKTDTITNHASISLFTGAVEITANNQNWKMLPGEEFLWEKGDSSPRIVKFDERLVACWKMETFDFNDEPLLRVFKILEARYDTTILVKNVKKLENQHITLSINSNNTLHEILEIISVTNNITFIEKKSEKGNLIFIK
ncbi:FecR family protein [Abyssalbus ytuae]|uniref:FecR family protein n=1 Tax=Abyssalbus ytuae TaxID=2926907 RepID=A0A9E7CTY0_9FLAO|nr:FecR family protein [Abyssalbus ytuae]UOB17097.1 FecR family protein [Abyssalbus ytuae]